MRVSIEWFLIDNWLMNASTLALASALCGLRLKKLLGVLLCLLGAAYALLALWKWPWLLALPFRILFGASLAFALRFDGWRGGLRAAACVFLSAFLLGGLMFALSFALRTGEEAYSYAQGVLIGSLGMRAVLIALPAVALMPRTFRRFRSAARVQDAHVQVRVTCAGQKIVYRALLDTGNLLMEPVSSRPVMLVNDTAINSGGYPVQFQSAGGAGEVFAHLPECAQVFVDGRWRQIDIMLARAPTPIDGADAVLGSIALPVAEHKGTKKAQRSNGRAFDTEPVIKS